MDLSEIRRKILAGSGMKDLIMNEDVKNYSQLQFAEKIKKYCVTPQFIEREVFWLWGPSGCGKTKRMWEIIQEKGGDFWSHPGGRFFDGYDGASIAIFDDFRHGALEFNTILKITDRYPCTVEVKGSSCPWAAKYVFFTAPEPPDQIFKCVGEDLQQIKRRITHLLGPPEICPEVQKVIV